MPELGDDRIDASRFVFHGSVLQPAILSCPPPSAGPLSALRAATRSHHDRIDALVNLRRLQERSHYERVLRVLDSFLAGWEPAVTAALPQRSAWLRARSRRPFLQRDLRDLGLVPLRPAALPPLASAAAAWGSVYVMEGSALGGMVISRSLAGAGLGPDHGAAYFHGWGEDTGRMWREAREVLEAELASPDALDQACEAARLTFDSLSALMEAAVHEPVIAKAVP
jgi:heme oxygenase